MSPETEEAIRAFAETAEGWTPLDRMLELAEMIVSQKPLIVVEIGVFAGRSFIPQALALKENDRGFIYGIDPWRTESALEGENADNQQWWAQVDLFQMHKLAVLALWKYQLEDFSLLIQSPSQNCSQLFPLESIDFLTIDGCHSEVASCRDVKTYLPLVAPGGTVIFDDTDWPSTNKAMAMLDRTLKLEKDGGNYRIYQKRKEPFENMTLVQLAQEGRL